METPEILGAILGIVFVFVVGILYMIPMADVDPGLDIEIVPTGVPQVPPPALPEDGKLKELLANLAKRLDTLNASVLDGNNNAEAQRKDVKKLADLIMEDTTIGFDDFKKKIVSENIPNQIESKGGGLLDMISLFIPDICGDLSDLFKLKREADKEHGTPKA